MIGPWQLALILLIVLVVFGAGKLPKVMGELGKGVKSLKNSLKDEEQDAKTQNHLDAKIDSKS